MADKIGRRPIPARNLGIMQRAARWMAQKGLTPNMISAIGLVFGVGAGVALWCTGEFPGVARLLWAAAAVMVMMRGLANMFDGMVAVEQGHAGPTGLFWNELPDRVSDVALLVGAGYGLGGSVVAGWLTACLALFVTYVRAIVVLSGAPPDFRGPFAKQQRMFSVAGLGLFLAFAPEDWRFSWGPDGAWGPMAALLWIQVPGIGWTAMRRIRKAARALGQADHQ